MRRAIGKRAIEGRALSLVAALLPLAAASPVPESPQAPVQPQAQQMTSVGGMSNSFDVCGVLQAAYGAASRSPTPGYPSSLVDPRHSIDDLKDFVPAYRARLPLSAAEFADLQSEQPRYAWPHFIPDCRWTGKRDVRPEQAKATMSFTFPIFSRDRSVAMVDVSFYRGSFGHGVTCVVRKSGQVWTARCIPGWIT